MRNDDARLIVGLLTEQLAELRAMRFAVERLSRSTLSALDRQHLTRILPALRGEHEDAYFLAQDAANAPAVRGLRLSTKSLGRLFARAELQVIDGLFLERGTRTRGMVRWRVEKICGFEGFRQALKHHVGIVAGGA